MTVVCAMGMYVNSTLIMSGFFLNLLSIILSIYLMF
jgi:Bax inhibitor 1